MNCWIIFAADKELSKIFLFLYVGSKRNVWKFLKISQNCEFFGLGLSYPFDLLTRPIFDLFTKQKQIVRYVIICMR